MTAMGSNVHVESVSEFRSGRGSLRPAVAELRRAFYDDHPASSRVNAAQSVRSSGWQPSASALAA